MRISDWSSDMCSSDLFGLAERDEGLEATLTAHEVKPRLSGSLADRDRLLQPEMGNAIHQLLEDPLVANPRVENGDQIDRHRADFGGRRAHAATFSGTRRVRSKSASSVSKR